MVKGINSTGKEFDLYGRRLGGSSQQPPLSSLRQTALVGAESRARHRALLPSGPQYLGGDKNIKSSLSPIQAAAMAAERRLHDDKWCGSKSQRSEPQIRENTSSSEASARSIQTSAIQSATTKEKFDRFYKVVLVLISFNIKLCMYNVLFHYCIPSRKQ